MFVIRGNCLLMHTPLTLLQSMTDAEKSRFREWLLMSHAQLVTCYDELTANQVAKAPFSFSDNATQETAIAFNTDAQQKLIALIPEFFAHTSTSPIIRLYHLLAQIQVLFERNQMQYFTDLIARAKAIAQQHFLLPELEKILQFEQKLLENFSDNTTYDAQSKTLFYEQSQLYEQLNNLWAYKELYLKVSNWGYLASVKTDRVKWLMHIIDHPLLQSERAAYSLNARILYHSIKAIIFKNSDKPHEAFVHTKALMELFYQHADYAEIEWSAFLAALQQHADMALQLHYYDDALLVSDFLKQIDTIYHFANTHQLQSDLRIRALLIELRYYKETAQFTNALNLVPVIEPILQQDNPPITDASYAAHTLAEIAQILFISGNFEQLITYITKIYSMAEVCPDMAIHMQAQMLQALAMYETGNTGATMAEQVTRMKQFFKDNHISLRFETLFIDMVKKLGLQQPNTVQASTVLKNYAILFDAVRANKDTYFHLLIMAWIESKLQNQPITQLLPNKANAEMPVAKTTKQAV